MMKIIFCLLGIYLLFSNAHASSVRSYKYSSLNIDGNQLTLNVFDSSVLFFALGDWGGSGIPLATKSPSELTSAALLGLQSSKTKFQIGLGDNFYYYGVKNVNDHLFHEIFEEVYSTDGLKQSPWFHLLGNHDYYGNASAQIDYMSVSNRWIMPNYNYTVDIKTNNGRTLIKLLMIDTIKLCGNTNFSLFSTSSASSAPGYASDADRKLADLYFADLDSRLSQASTSGASYIIVAGHFPVYSAAEHGSTQCLVDRLAPMLHKYKVSLYLSGHDHNLQHISVTSGGSTVEYMVSGANSLNNNSQDKLVTVPAGALKFQWPNPSTSMAEYLAFGGFLKFEGDASKLTVSFNRASLLLGKTMYTKVIYPRT